MTLRDYSIKAPKRTVTGDLVLKLTNLGPNYHELVIAQGLPSSIPLTPDGVNVDERELELRGRVESSVEPLEPDTAQELRVSLRPGRYTLICNLPGHFLGGMSAKITVLP